MADNKEDDSRKDGSETKESEKTRENTQRADSRQDGVLGDESTKEGESLPKTALMLPGDTRALEGCRIALCVSLDI